MKHITFIVEVDVEDEDMCEEGKLQELLGRMEDIANQFELYDSGVSVEDC